eukprot:3295857-Karenia_brevis.AAC.1
MHDLSIAYKKFNSAAQVAGLTLKPHFLQQHFPLWAQFTVAAAAEYLGIFLGPGAHRLHWAAQ